ncbi:GspE/PulE family protein [Candidatus Parcubacteria bacterium]|nr:GspE/PulE family protein [Candidatus Parcubacteria bacterium]
MHIDETELKKFLLDSGLVSKSDVEEAVLYAEEKKASLGRVLVTRGVITEDELRRMHSYILGIPFVDLKNQKLSIETLSLIPEPIARNHNIVAFKQSGDSLEVAMLDVEDLRAIDFVGKSVGKRILPRLTDNESMKWALLSYQKSLKEEFGSIIEKEAGSIRTEGKGDEADLEKVATDAPVVRIVDTLLKHAIAQNASDIHIEPQDTDVLVRYRIDGILHDAMFLPKNTAQGLTARIKVLSSLKLDEKRIPQDGRFKIELDGERVSFRVSTLPTYYGEKTVMRILRENASGFTLESLGFHGYGLDTVHKALSLTTGMILTTGPTGSGKTTTLYTLLDIVNTPDVNISTIEDPIEYQMKRINQTQVRPEIGFSFAQGLRTLVRQDPDIIMVGEIRDNETAALAVNAALTGHLVLSTLHTNSAAGAIPRLLDMKVEPFLLSSTLQVILAQRLVRKLGNNKEKHFLNKEEIGSLGHLVDLDRMLAHLKAENLVPKDAAWETIPFWKPAKAALPAPAGEGDGYQGRIGIYEVLKMTDAVKALVMRNATSTEIEEVGKKDGMITMMEDGVFKAVSGDTSLEEVLRVISE